MQSQRCRNDGWRLGIVVGGAAFILLFLPSTPFASAPVEIVFISSVAPYLHQELFVMRADGSHVRKLSPLPGEYASPSFSPDNRKIIFSLYVSADQSPGQVYIIDADGSHVKRLTESPGYNGKPYFIPTGRVIYTHYSPLPTDWSSDAQTYVMDADGSNKRVLSAVLPWIEGGRTLSQFDKVAVSPQGRLAFRISTNELFVVSVDGLHAKRIPGTQNIEPDSPMWNPDGTRLAYITRTGQDRARLFVVSADGRQTKELPTPPNVWIDHPVWSPDGTRIAYLSFGSLDGSSKHDGIYVIDAEGAKFSREVPLDFSQAWPWPQLHDLSFGPDGRSLMFSANLDGTLQVYVKNIDTGLKRLTHPPSENRSPSFSH